MRGMFYSMNCTYSIPTMNKEQLKTFRTLWYIHVDNTHLKGDDMLDILDSMGDDKKYVSGSKKYLSYT